MTRAEANALRRKYAGNTSIVEHLNVLERQERELETAEGERLAELKRMIGRTVKELRAAIANNNGE